MRRGLLLIGGLGAMLAAGCGSARPMRYYTLDRPAANAQPADSAYAVSLLVGRISAPHVLRDDRIAYGMTDVEMGLYYEHRWSEPPPEMLETMLVEKLRASGKYKAVQKITSSSRGDYILRGHLSSLNEMDLPSGIAGRFAMQLELFQPKTGTVVWTESYSHDEPVAGKKVNDVVEALQKNVEAGLNQLTAGLDRYFAALSSK
jgi:cholesterol transport system auxiliary component